MTASGCVTFFGRTIAIIDSRSRIPAAGVMSTRPTSRIEKRFRDLRERGEQGLVIYLTAGDPSLDATGDLLTAIDRGGADIIELGVPFSDPLADGPMIQRASCRALPSGPSLHKLLEPLPLW